jgi:hypothetical protein
MDNVYYPSNMTEHLGAQHDWTASTVAVTYRPCAAPSADTVSREGLVVVFGAGKAAAAAGGGLCRPAAAVVAQARRPWVLGGMRLVAMSGERLDTPGRTWLSLPHGVIVRDCGLDRAKRRDGVGHRQTGPRARSNSCGTKLHQIAREVSQTGGMVLVVAPTDDDIRKLDARARAVGERIGWELHFKVAPNPDFVGLAAGANPVFVLGPSRLADLLLHDVDLALDRLERGKQRIVPDEDGDPRLL